ncbi:hypothetical protein [Mameliella sediminis]|uniref:hypothetical protein n=1 Tax=Mameliella sediminis TaxID=2836866 RepID=UPI001C43D881|nr:hypothetical protein [Mameliella sediminis]MBY6112977.1 hypothetical protein [Antarctobacter heliothermus]MBY6143675.1 hypothetical protein [Mameliella alba]MBV7394259.1 hypothetical protein [Mameliella sediminis]MBY6162329.1 hypothetical protein [Mameliella alba]MBY6170803.1 hypothetical protein [Mameliella alba]
MPEDAFIFETFTVDLNRETFYLVNRAAVENHFRHQSHESAREAALESLNHAKSVIQGLITERYDLDPNDPPPLSEFPDI